MVGQFFDVLQVVTLVLVAGVAFVLLGVGGVAVATVVRQRRKPPSVPVAPTVLKPVAAPVPEQVLVDRLRQARREHPPTERFDLHERLDRRTELQRLALAARDVDPSLSRELSIEA